MKSFTETMASDLPWMGWSGTRETWVKRLKIVSEFGEIVESTLNSLNVERWLEGDMAVRCS